MPGGADPCGQRVGRVDPVDVEDLVAELALAGCAQTGRANPALLRPGAVAVVGDDQIGDHLRGDPERGKHGYLTAFT